LAITLLFAAIAPCSFALESDDDPAWVLFEKGKRAFLEKRFGEALDDFRQSVRTRRERFEDARARLDRSIGKGADAIKEDRITVVIDSFAKKEILSWKYEEIKRQAGGSMKARIVALRGHTLSERFSLFLDALEVALEYGSWERLRDSVKVLREELVRLADFPEAEYWIGRVFMLEGEYALALTQFDRAYSMRASFEIPEDVYLVMYARVECLKRINMSDYEGALEAICATDPVYGSAENELLRDSMLRVLVDKGFDSFVTLYRHDASYALAAYDEYGTYLYERSRPRAVLTLALAANIIATRMIDRVRAIDPTYSFTWDKTIARSMPEGSDGLRGLFARIDRMPELGSYAEEAGFYRILFTLGNALFANGARTSAREIWAALSSFPRADVYATKAARQLSNPVIVSPVK
jgi:tetratricopeptide (TPR) repeat protein